MNAKKQRRISGLPVISSLKFNSIFTRTLLLLVLLVLIVILLFYYFVNHHFQERYTEEYSNSCFSMLGIMSDVVDAELASLKVQISDLFKTSDCNSLIVSGDTYKNETSIRVALDLSNLVQREDNAQAACLYIEKSECIISSDRIIERKNISKYLDILTEYERIRTAYPKGNFGDNNYLVLYSDKLFVFQEYPAGKRLAVIWVEINLQSVYSLLKQEIGENGSEYTIFAYLNGRPVFTRQLQYPSSDNLSYTTENVIDSQRSAFERADSSGGYILKYTSGTSGLDYILLMANQSFTLSLATIFEALVPYIAVILVLLLIVSLGLIQSIYRPIQRLISAMVSGQKNISSGENLEKVTNEIGLIKYLQQRSEDRQNLLGNILNGVSSAVSDKLFRDIIYNEIDNERAEETLRLIGSPYPAEGKYQVLIVQWYYDSDTFISQQEQEMHGVNITQIIAHYFEGKNLVCSLDERTNKKIFILCFPEECTTGRAKRIMLDFEAFIANGFSSLACKLQTGSSKIYSSIFDLPEAYNDAKRNLQEKMYYSGSMDNDGGILALYNEQLSKAMEQMQENSALGIRQLSDLARSSDEHPDAAARIYAMIMDFLLSKLDALNIEQQESWIQQRKIIESDLSPLKEQDNRRDLINSFIAETSQAVSTAVNKAQFYHIETAKKYIEENYWDTDLSLQTVSDKCRITSSYLSRLFVKYLPPGFIEYLNLCRVDKAAQMLINSDYSIMEIGFKTGFNSPQNFIRVFKKYKGETPGQFRIRKAKEK